MKRAKIVLLVFLVLNLLCINVLADGEVYSFNLDGFEYEFGHGYIDNTFPVSENSLLYITAYMGSKFVDITELQNGMPDGLYVRDIMSVTELVSDYDWEVHKDEYIPLDKEMSYRFVTFYDPNVVVNVKAIAGDGTTKNITFPDQTPILANDRTLLPIRMIAELYGWTVNWDADAQKVIITGNSIEIEIKINENVMWKKSTNGTQMIHLDVPAVILNGRTLLPVRAISEAMGIVVDWSQEDQCVILK